jgi:hypothetical protein
MDNPQDYVELARQTVAYLQPVVGELGLAVAGHALWDFLKTKLKGRAAQALEEAMAQPHDNAEWTVFETRLRQALEVDPALADELRALLPSPATDNIQSARIDGDDNTVVQIDGSGNTVNANRGAR